MNQFLATLAVPIVVLGLLGSLMSCGSESRRSEPTVSMYRDHAEWSRQVREIEARR